MKKNRNKILFLILLLLIILSVVVFAILNFHKDEGNNIQDDTEIDTPQYQNGDISYYDYYKDGKINIGIKEYVKLPENYLEYEITSNNREEIGAVIFSIIENSEVTIPTDVLNGYYGDVYNSAKAGAELENKSLDEYIKSVYSYESYEKYIEENTKFFEEEIKKDLVYQALAEDFNISITKADVEEYFSERLSNGDTYESLIQLFGEKLMYKYTMQDKVEKTLVEKLK